MVKLPPILQVGDVLISSDILTEEFCCDLEVCHGICCVEMRVLLSLLMR